MCDIMQACNTAVAMSSVVGEIVTQLCLCCLTTVMLCWVDLKLFSEGQSLLLMTLLSVCIIVPAVSVSCLHDSSGAQVICHIV